MRFEIEESLARAGEIPEYLRNGYYRRIETPAVDLITISEA